ncbi:aspartate-semialdehyde dehydrogenase [Candidatus Bodocaedibacter vickermanii]|uniref:Aspartate-semialdehyde dehydrogenase n=1 Tax=Candidatus Bodocaedibacter vickermanii TaxID=2741701 RepID=A0A7L9RRW3_9PROT|nr:Aspartate-semialdehyde dehydrogenase 2 [Candidatus Paracaedibacteraceae bacterium 'Lake Konstanz']
MKKIALVGAAGNVGRKIVEIINERDSFPDVSITPIGSMRSQGEKIHIKGHDLAVVHIDTIDFSHYDLAIFAAGSKAAQDYVPKATQAGCPVVDCSSFYRMDPKVPLVVPPVNLKDVERYTEKKIISSANCIASPITTVLAPLHQIAPIDRVVLSTYQSVSGAGKDAMNELMHQTKAFYTTMPYQRKVFPKDIAFNVLPMIDVVHPNGNTGEETKIALEIKKVLDRNISIAVQSVRVPVFISHCVSVFVEFSGAITPDQAKDALRLSPHVTVIDDMKNYYSALDAAGEDQVFVSRLRYDPSVENGLIFWTASDNLRRGAALDAVEIAEHLLTKYL